jgi:acetate kinase
MNVLVLNCGSSSIKYQLFDMPDGTALAKGGVARIGEDGADSAPDHHAAVARMLEELTDPVAGVIASVAEIDACGHRVVHGGEACSGSRRIDDELVALIESFSDLAPLHNPPNLTGIREMRRVLGDTPQVAVFDTAFHQTIPEYAYRYALPESLYTQFRIRRYGFHGTSHQYVAARARHLLGLAPEETDLITCHLGNGCSITAVKGGRSVDTSMGFTPLEGVMMGTRSGSFDPAVLLYLLNKGYDAAALDRLVNKESGLLGISGLSNDVRDLEAAAADGHRPAALALEMFAYHVRKTIGAYLAALGRCRAVVLTGGIGENAAELRARILGGLDGLGIALDTERNTAEAEGERDIAADDSSVRILVIPTDEERAIADETVRLVNGGERHE